MSTSLYVPFCPAVVLCVFPPFYHHLTSTPTCTPAPDSPTVSAVHTAALWPLLATRIECELFFSLFRLVPQLWAAPLFLLPSSLLHFISKQFCLFPHQAKRPVAASPSRTSCPWTSSWRQSPQSTCSVSNNPNLQQQLWAYSLKGVSVWARSHQQLRVFYWKNSVFFLISNPSEYIQTEEAESSGPSCWWCPALLQNTYYLFGGNSPHKSFGAPQRRGFTQGESHSAESV